jgi:hypothetical protein
VGVNVWAVTGQKTSDIVPVAKLSEDGSTVTIKGRVSCAEGGNTVRIEVDLTQASTGAGGMGVWEGSCSAGVIQWSTDIESVSSDFQEGNAHASAEATSLDAGSVIIESHAWERDVKLLMRGKE